MKHFYIMTTIAVNDDNLRTLTLQLREEEFLILHFLSSSQHHTLKDEANSETRTRTISITP